MSKVCFADPQLGLNLAKVTTRDQIPAARCVQVMTSSNSLFFRPYTHPMIGKDFALLHLLVLFILGAQLQAVDESRSVGSLSVDLAHEEEEEEFYKLLPANKADHLCQLWQSCSDLHKIQTVYDLVENPHSIRLSKK